MQMFPEREQSEAHEAVKKALLETVSTADQDIVGIVPARVGNPIFEILPQVAEILSPRRKMDITLILEGDWRRDKDMVRLMLEIGRKMSVRTNARLELVERWQLTRPPISPN